MMHDILSVPSPSQSPKLLGQILSIIAAIILVNEEGLIVVIELDFVVFYPLVIFLVGEEALLGTFFGELGDDDFFLASLTKSTAY